ncbi:MAG: NAD(P)H-dependent oxidoreductase [Deltaproteobacteria bacterium]|nr:NAD(P)H-dependent oxidoreductase [Deltaproteobacteria bacterium]
MKVLIVYAHPNPESFNHAILQAFTSGLSAAGHTYEVVDLYAINFNPCLSVEDFVKISEGSNSDDVLSQQAKVNEADALAFIHPIWWTGTPAMLKGWIDRVFSLGYAYTMEEGTGRPIGLLKHKKALILTTAGSPEELAEMTGSAAALEKIWCHEIIQFCGIDDVRLKVFYSVIVADDETRKGYLDEARQLGEDF